METISVGITHYNRTEFIEEAITPLLKDDRVGEIVIVDDFSDDYGELLKIVSEIDDTNKVNIFRNSNNMGAFKNNIITAKHCQKPWIILMDSNNIIEKDYIDVLHKLHSWDPDIIYCPDWAITFPEKPSSPFLNYTIYDNQKFHIQDIKKHHFEIANFWSFLNNGNYFINREAYLRVLWKNKDIDIPACGSLLANTFWLMENHCLYVVENLRYHHRVHEGSNYLRNAKKYSSRIAQIKKDCKNSLLKAQRTPSCEFTGEYGVLHHLIKNGLLPFSGAFFDIGANIGDWTEHLLQLKNDLEVHVFEPVPHNFSKLIDNLSEPIKRGQIHPNNCAMCQEDGFKSFYYYETQPRWSTFYRRDLQVEKEYNLSPPRTFSVYSTTLDEYCHRLNLKRISFIKIDVEGAELDVFHGANKLLAHDRIDYIQFEYGGTYIDAGITLQQVFDYLHGFGFMIFSILPNGLKYQPQFLPELEDFNYANFLAVNARFRSQLLSETPKMLDLGQLCKKHSIIPRGIIHIGAHEGKETEKYLEMGAEKILFVEANPAVFERLKKNTSRFPEVQAVNCAISDHSGSTTLHVTSMDESSSLLPLKHHKNYYPDIRESQDITVTSKTLDGLLEELSLSKDDYNILNIDIQGAELLAFKGASNTLRHIECINSEVNYEELYEGCAIIDQVDAFLEGYGFKRTKTTTPYHHSWGDAFYVKKSVVTMATLGNPRYGRFANQLFQYAFLKIYAKKHDMHIETAEWIGKALFGADDPPVSKKLPLVRQETYKLAEDHIPNAKVPYKNVDFGGIFQYHTSIYAPYKEYFRSLFKPVSLIEDYLVNGYNKLKAMGNTIIGLHLRRGDYGYSHYFVAPTSWYLQWLDGYWETLDNPVLFIASDEPEKVLGDFEKFAPVTCKDLGIQINGIELYPDFYILSQCDILAISNSSFSFAAAMLNENANVFFRPHLPSQKLIPFDPWHGETIFRDAKEEDYAEKKHASEAACRKDQNETGTLSETAHEIVTNSVKAANGTDAITAPELSHTSALHHNEQGTLCFNAGNMEEARTHFKKAARLQPNNYDFLRNLADFYYVKDRSIENALEIYQKILECYPDNVETLQITGNICVALERFNEAQAYYSRLLKIEPWNSKIQEKLDALRTSSIGTPSISEIQP